MKIRISTRNKTSGDVREVEAEGADYLTVKAGLLEAVPNDAQLLFVRVDRPEVIR